MSFFGKAKALVQGVSMAGVATAIDTAGDKLKEATGYGFNDRQVQFDLGCLRVNIEELTQISEKLIGITPKHSIEMTSVVSLMDTSVNQLYATLNIPKPPKPVIDQKTGHSHYESEQSFPGGN